MSALIGASRLRRGSIKVRGWSMQPVNWIRNKWINRHVPSAHDQVQTLGNFIMNEVPGEPSQNQGAIETAIRLLRAHVPGVQNRIHLDWDWRNEK